MFGLPELPAELVLSHLTLSDLARAACVSKAFRTVCGDMCCGCPSSPICTNG